MQKEGYVVFSNEKIAQIRIKRESSCGGNCSHCKGCGTDEVLIEVENMKGFQQGETVLVIMSDSSFLKKSFIGYGLLIFLILVGAVLGYELFNNELISLLFLTVFAIIGIFILRIIFKKKESEVVVARLD